MDERVSKMFFGTKKPKKDPNPHSKAYHRYFENYIERQVEKEDGSLKIERVYAGSYYTRKETDRKWITEKVLYLVFSLISFICYILAGVQNVESNLFLYALIPQVLAVLGLLWLSALAIFFAGTKRRIVERTHRRCGYIRWASISSSVCLVFCAIVAVAFGLFWARDELWPEVMTACFYLVGAVLTGLIFWNESKITYDEEVSDVKPKEDEYLIRA